MAEKKKKSKSPESTPWAVCGRCGKNVAEYIVEIKLARLGAAQSALDGVDAILRAKNGKR